MQKQAKPAIPLGRKRQRRTSGQAFEANIIKNDPSNSPPKLKAPKLKKSKTKQKVIATKVDMPEGPTKPTNLLESKTVKEIKTVQKGQILDTKHLVESNSKKRKLNSENLKTTTTGVLSPKKKKKKFSVTISEPITTNLEAPDPIHLTSEIIKKGKDNLKTEKAQKSTKQKVPNVPVTFEEITQKFPILNDKALIERFMKVPMSNNQKGRIRLAIKASLQDTSNIMHPEIIHGKMQALLKESSELPDSALRRIRILYNMLKIALENPSQLDQVEKPKKKKEKGGGGKEEGDTEDGEKKEKPVQKVKGPKRYVVFLGNLPLTINKEQIMNHFRELNEQIKDIRLPKVTDGKKSAIAFVELSNEPSYELALSKHHSMLGNKRIKVLYTTQQNTKISKSDAKSKSAKLIAMQKSGQLVGSTPQGKRRSHRRAIMKKARAKEAAAASA